MVSQTNSRKKRETPLKYYMYAQVLGVLVCVCGCVGAAGSRDGPTGQLLREVTTGEGAGGSP